MAKVEEIVAVEGVDVIFIGPGDLSVSINALGPEGAKKLEAAILTIAKAARAAGKAVGIFRPSPDDVGKWRDAEITFYLIASDTMFLGAGVASAVSAARSA
ncbi:2-dehydro-3-deoxyglucarate aldolase [Mycobacterium tuberculosis]|nr:2-dehydro-3-deoxyglucarate aldolase [Mycobacterium tuberculosis]